MIDLDRLPRLKEGYRWLQPKLGGNPALVDRAVVEYQPMGFWVAMVQESPNSAGFRATVGLHRPESSRASERWADLPTAARWIARWVELRHDRLLAEMRAASRP